MITVTQVAGSGNISCCSEAKDGEVVVRAITLNDSLNPGYPPRINTVISFPSYGNFLLYFHVMEDFKKKYEEKKNQGTTPPTEERNITLNPL